MNKFELTSQEMEPTLFSGQEFYDIYKDSEFLRHNANVETMLSKGYELRNMLKKSDPGERVSIGMMIKRNTPLVVVKTGPLINIENFEFTRNRLYGLVAAFAFDNRQRFLKLSSTESHILGLTWDNQDEKKCRLFLSAIGGTEFFYNHFKFWPLVCALRKYQIYKIRQKLVLEIANVKNDQGITMAEDMMNNFEVAMDLWGSFSGTSCDGLIKLLDRCPPEIKILFKNKS